VSALIAALGLAVGLLTSACDSTDANKPNAKADTKPGKTDEAPAKAEPEAEPEPAPAPAPEADKPPPGVKVHGNLPMRTHEELAAEDTARSECVSKCVEGRKAEAIGADAIEGECQTKCMTEHPIEQVEVVDGPFPQ
jgi:hypothetical protein